MQGYIDQRPGPACVEALVAESAVEAFDVPFCIGRPGWMWIRPTLKSSAQPITRREVESDPLSERTLSGQPR
jgi:hypothetical protein